MKQTTMGWASAWVCGLVCGLALSGCGEEAKPPARNPYYVAVEQAFRSCTSFAQCHQSGGVGDVAAMFPLGQATRDGDFRTALVNVPSCEYNLMNRVTPGDPDNSWLMVKLTAPYTPDGIEAGRILFTPDSNWSEADKCNPLIPGFGKRMPDTAPFMIPQASLDAIRTWIEMGAPGPNDPLPDAGMM